MRFLAALILVISATAIGSVDPEELDIAARWNAVEAGDIPCQTDYECEVLSPTGEARFIGPQMFCNDPWFYGHGVQPPAECEQ